MRANQKRKGENIDARTVYGKPDEANFRWLPQNVLADHRSIVIDLMPLLAMNSSKRLKYELWTGEVEEMASPGGRPLQCNQQNYARWTVKYYDNLLKVAETHLDLYEEFKQSCFGVKLAAKATD
ncbi:uncharacterized protein TNCV_4623741 [Trichonephila clavipes]|nr:uncharacterized protein TNCV_4623741 [Trichonephila clavipes]